MKKRVLTMAVCLLVTALLMPVWTLADDTAYAWPSDQIVRVDDAIENLHMYALLDVNGYATNYVRVRDVAYILNSSPSQFSVDYYGGMVHLAAGQGYVPDGSEMTIPFTGAQPYTRIGGPTDINGQEVMMDTVLMVDGAGGGHTYYKLRDLGVCMNFIVNWTVEDGVTISTVPVQ